MIPMLLALAATTPDLARLAAEDGAQAVVLVSLPTDPDAAWPAWRRAHPEARLVAVSPETTCPPRPAWAHATACGLALWSALAGAPAAAWDWRGRPLARGGPAELQAVLRRPHPELRVVASEALLAPGLRAAVASGKWATSAAPRAPPRRPEAACAEEPQAYLLALTPIGAGVQASLLDAAGRCRVAEARGPDAPGAVLALVHELARAPELRAPPAPLDAADAPPARPRPPPAALTEFAEAWVGTRYQRGGAGKGGIDDAHLARTLYRQVYGRDIGAKLADQLKSGPEVVLPKGDITPALQPGDLVFMVTYAYLPRSVAVYLGGGKLLQSEVIRGVVLADIPKNVPDFLYLVARRPLAPR